MKRKIRVVVAMTTSKDSSLINKALADGRYALDFAQDLRTVEQLMNDADIIIADTEFSSGAFTDWMSLWPVPAIMVVDPSYDVDRLSKNMVDESSAFLIRDPNDDWIRFIPMLAGKVTSVRESLNRQNNSIIRVEGSYMRLLRAIPDIVYVLDGDGYFIYLNDAVSQLGWKPSELIGKHFAEIVHPDDFPEVCRSMVLRRYEGIKTGDQQAPKLFDERRTGERMTRGLSLRLRHRDDPDWNRMAIDSWGEITSLGVSLPEFQGNNVGTMGLIHDISKHRDSELKLTKELVVRDTLLKEIHHRVKNNLQVVSSLLSLESDCIEDDKGKSVFVACQTQVQSMALVHEQLYRGTSLEGVDAQAYFVRLTEYLAGVHDSLSRGIHMRVEAENIALPIDKAMPLSIIATELISNSFKHGFSEAHDGTISISLQRSGEVLEFRVSDDGIGFSAAKAAPRETAHKGIGMDLLESLVTQIGGALERIDSGGAQTVIRFPVPLSE
ncbi:MAG: histidine kinase dimerization/phosphoacceptor domain -containing protein [Spirochaetia bacterium]|jgi:PAS domain S-box-containing protein|nr:histidine kinase dimerization/phosphoacceptor domain -containing protein [Spirochaetia bacterium]